MFGHYDFKKSHRGRFEINGHVLSICDVTSSAKRTRCGSNASEFYRKRKASLLVGRSAKSFPVYDSIAFVLPSTQGRSKMCSTYQVQAQSVDKCVLDTVLCARRLLVMLTWSTYLIDPVRTHTSRSFATLKPKSRFGPVARPLGAMTMILADIHRLKVLSDASLFQSLRKSWSNVQYDISHECFRQSFSVPLKI